LAQSDFGFELQVGHLFDEVPSQKDVFCPIYVEPAQYNGSYMDSSNGKSKKFTYRWKIALGDTAARDIKCALLAVECKILDPDSPIVICGTTRKESEANLAFVESRFDPTTNARFCVTRKNEGISKFYSTGSFVGKSMMRVRGEGEHLNAVSDPMLLEKSADALASAAGQAETACVLSRKGWNTVFSVVLPIVVVPDGCLWALEFDPGGEVKTDPQPVDECAYFVGKKLTLTVGNDMSKPFVLSHIHFFTLTGFRNVLAKLKQDKTFLTQIFPEQSAELAP
jgi:hypothetical protein